MEVSSLRTECSARQKINSITRIMYHAAAILVIFEEFLSILAWENHALALSLGNIIWVLLLVLAAAQLIRSVPRGIITLAIIAVVIVTYHTSQSKDYYFREFVVLFLLSDQTEENTMKRLLLLLYIMLAGYLAVLNLKGVANDLQVQFTYATGHSLGFGHPNTPGAFIVSATIVFRMTIFRKKRILFAVFCVLMAALAWFAAACRTAAILLLIYPLTDFITKAYCRNLTKPKRLLISAVPIGFFLASFLIMLYCLKHSISTLDSNMMARFTYPAAFIKQYGVTLFGANLNGTINDNGYLRILVERGIIPEILFLASLSYVIYRAAGRKDSSLAATWCLYCLYGVMEGCLFMPVHNTLILFALSQETTEPIEPSLRKPLNQKLILSGIVAILTIAGILFLPSIGRPVLQYETKDYNNTSTTPLIDENTTISQSFYRDYPVRSIKLLTYTAGTKASGQYILELEDENHNILETQTIDGNNIRDCNYLEIVFSKLYPAGTYQINLRGKDNPDDTVSIWKNDLNPFADGDTYISGERTDADLNFAIGEQIIGEDWVINSMIIFAGIYLLLFIWLVDLKLTSVSKRNAGTI